MTVEVAVAPASPTVSVEEALRLPLTVSPLAKVEEALLWNTEATVRVSIREVVALSPPLTVSPEAKVEEALTRIPAAVFVGDRVLREMACQAPFCPRVLASVPQDRRPVELESIVSQDTRLSRVTAPEANRVPMSRELPSTPRVVEGAAVPIPTRFSLALTTRVVRSAMNPPLISVLVEVCPDVPTVRVEEADTAPLIRRVELKVELARTKMPAAVLVGVRVLPKICSQAPLGAIKAPQLNAPLSAISCRKLFPAQAVPK
jgi:hypothetical protein